MKHKPKNIVRMARNPENLFRLNNKIAVVTGGAGFLGKPITEGLAEAGAKVVIASRNQEKNKEAVKQWQKKNLDVSSLYLDMSKESSVKKFCEHVMKEYGRVDILVNNSVIRTMKDFWSGNVKDWQKSLNVNILGIHLCTQYVVKNMISQKSGVIINISSIYGVVSPTWSIYKGTQLKSPPDYAIHKAGIINYTRYLATLFAPNNIRVNCLTVGGLGGWQENQFVKQYNEHCPMKRMAREEDIKGPIVFLASDASQYMTGHNLIVDGGWTAW
jgi:NAD(P)-dependent dehydrogenase (short-subunit alcohol dehydrogenase family)